MEDENKKNKVKLLLYVPLVTLAVSVIGNIFQYCNYKSQLNHYKEQLKPEIECFYRYFAGENKYKFVIKNIGLVNCKDIWAQEKIFMIHDDEVFEGEDVPHYNYVVYNGSRTRMWDLKKNDEIELEQVKHQLLAFEKLRVKYEPRIISKWNVAYSHTSTSKRYQIEKYFIFDYEDRLFKEPENYVGGLSILNKIKDYESFGSNQTVNIFNLTGDFEINAPNTYLINPDYSLTILYPWSKVSLKQFNKSLLFSVGEYEIQPADDVEGSIRYTWEFKNGKWEKVPYFIGKGPFYSKVMKLALAYLPTDEAKKVEQNPKLLIYFDEERRKPKQTIEEILEKARIKFLKNREKTH